MDDIRYIITGPNLTIVVELSVRQKLTEPFPSHKEWI